MPLTNVLFGKSSLSKLPRLDGAGQRTGRRRQVLQDGRVPRVAADIGRVGGRKQNLIERGVRAEGRLGLETLSRVARAVRKLFVLTLPWEMAFQSRTLTPSVVPVMSPRTALRMTLWVVVIWASRGPAMRQASEMQPAGTIRSSSGSRFKVRCLAPVRRRALETVDSSKFFRARTTSTSV